ncbi:MAG TPA: hypothetical protein VFW60_10655 [Rhodanobacteraceae bacterium]|nr:hypothetical protein [Rhodanobacteraceae bacterium]
MVSKRKPKSVGKVAKRGKTVKATRRARPRTAKVKKVARKTAARSTARAPARKARSGGKAAPKAGARSAKTIKPASPAKAVKPTRPASVKTAAKAVAAARANANRRRPPSYIPRSRFGDDWMLGGPVELPRQPNPAAHTPTRKPPKPRAPKPKAISHEQAVANLKALLESRKRKDRGGDSAAAKGA